MGHGDGLLLNGNGAAQEGPVLAARKVLRMLNEVIHVVLD